MPTMDPEWRPAPRQIEPDPIGGSGLFAVDEGDDGCSFYDAAGENLAALTVEDMEALAKWMDVRLLAIRLKRAASL